MKIIFITSVVINILSIFYILYKTRKINKEKLERDMMVMGRILLDDNNTLYIEMKDEDSIKTLHNSRYVIFEVCSKRNTLN